MTERPTLAVVVFTYDRPEYAERTLRSTLRNVRYDGEVRVHIADDGSPDGQVERLVEAAYEERGAIPVTTSNSERRGYGASFNLATQVTHATAQVVLALEDDWELVREVDLTPLVAALQEDDIGCIRLGYIGYTTELRGRFLRVAGQMYLLLDPDSPERHVFAGHPRIEAVAWERSVGLWPEGLDAGSTEHVVAGRDEARRGVAWPLDLVRPLGDLYAHIGTIQAREDQRAVGSV